MDEAPSRNAERKSGAAPSASIGSSESDRRTTRLAEMVLAARALFALAGPVRRCCCRLSVAQFAWVPLARPSLAFVRLIVRPRPLLVAVVVSVSVGPFGHCFVSSGCARPARTRKPSDAAYLVFS
jgi:hypothetical protein